MERIEAEAGGVSSKPDMGNWSIRLSIMERRVDRLINERDKQLRNKYKASG